MANAILKNNLELQNRNNEYINVKTKSNTIYATVTMIISFIASFMFNLNNYLPMFVSSGIFLFVVLAVMCFINIYFALVMIAFSLLLVVIMYKLGKKMEFYNRKSIENDDKI